MFCILKPIANATFCKKRLLLLQNFLQHPPQNQCKEIQIFQRKHRYAIYAIFLNMFNNNISRKEDNRNIENWKIRREKIQEKKKKIKLAGFPSPLCRKWEEQAVQLLSYISKFLHVLNSLFAPFSKRNEMLLPLNLLSKKDQSYTTTLENTDNEGKKILCMNIYIITLYIAYSPPSKYF